MGAFRSLKKLEVPSLLAFPGSRIALYYEAVEVNNSSQAEIQILGNKEGFLSLSNALLFFYNEDWEEEVLFLHELPYVESELVLLLFSGYGKKYSDLPDGKVFSGPDGFEWHINWEYIVHIAAGLHALYSAGDNGDHLHFDNYQKTKDPIELSVFAGLE